MTHTCGEKCFLAIFAIYLYMYTLKTQIHLIKFIHLFFIRFCTLVGVMIYVNSIVFLLNKSNVSKILTKFITMCRCFHWIAWNSLTRFIYVVYIYICAPSLMVVVGFYLITCWKQKPPSIHPKHNLPFPLVSVLVTWPHNHKKVFPGHFRSMILYEYVY